MKKLRLDKFRIAKLNNLPKIKGGSADTIGTENSEGAGLCEGDRPTPILTAGEKPQCKTKSDKYEAHSGVC